MQRKPNEQEIKQSLLSKLSEITLNSERDVSVVLAKDAKTKISVSKNYDIKKFRFVSGQFVQMIYGCSCHPLNEILLCVGVGKGCPDDVGRDELWFLAEGDKGITHFCGADALTFHKKEEKEELMLLEAYPMN